MENADDAPYPVHDRPDVFPNGGAAVVDALSHLGVEVVFGLPSVHNLPIYDALAASSVRTITMRDEHGAAGAADAFSRISGELGVCLTSTGPGAANAVGGLVEAFTSGTPVLHLTGQIETRHLDRGRGFIHEVPRQPQMLGAVSKAVLRATSSEDVAALVVRAGRCALEAPQAPVSLELPIDLQYAPAARVVDEVGGIDATVRADSYALPPGGLEATAAIAAAHRPIVWAGGGAVRAGAETVVASFARRIGAGVLTTPNARGVLPENDPLCIGNLAWDRDVRDLVRDADLLVGIGTRFQGPNTENWIMELPGRIVQIDVAPEVPGRNYNAEIAVQGDARQVLEAIMTALDQRGAPVPEASWVTRVSEVATSARSRLRGVIGAQAALLDELAAMVGPDTVVVKDSTIPAYTWGNRLLPVRRTRRSIMPNSFAIGLGVPHSIGAAVATGEPVVCMVGDGGIMVSLGELATISAENLPVVVLVFTDGGYGVLRNIQEKQYGRHVGVDLGRPDFCALARSLGLPSARVGTAGAFGRVVRGALASKAPFLLEVDLQSIGPMREPYTGTSKRPETARSS